MAGGEASNGPDQLGGIPHEGLTEEQLFARLDAFRAGDLDTKGGRTWAYVYDPGRADIDRVTKRALVEFYDENALDPTVFPSLLRIENEVIGLARDHLRGGPEVVGSFTTGGTESIMMAVKAARDRAGELQPELARPTMVLPVTAHAAFHKAAHYFDVEAISVPADTTTWKADVEAMAAACDERTILLVGSAVSYAHGVVDPIPELGQLALDKDLLLHVDGCIGGAAGAAPDVPEATAGINAILNVCPPELAERVLIEFFNRLYVPDPPA